MTTLDIIVPVLGRPDNAKPFMESLLSCAHGDLVVYPVVSESDVETAEAWFDQGVTPVVSRRGGRFAQKCQDVYGRTAAPWILLVGDDVEFVHGWWYGFQEAIDEEVGLIATNDMHNPFVLRGEHATHPIMRRAWVDDFGASWDGPGHIAHEGYWHSYVDAEWSARAHEDGVFVFADDCCIQHHHPTWGLAEYDDTYRLGMERYNKDARLFESRRNTYGRAA